jgi:ADP-ribose pyrophosphatase
VLGRLERVAEYYPSPGSMTEYIYSYVALSDLPDGVAGVFGAKAEAEDIKGHALPFAALMAAIAAGEVANAPLILTALWLERERERLRR